MRGLPLIVFIRNDSFGDEAFHPIAQLDQLGRKFEIDHAFLRADYPLAARRASSMPRANNDGMDGANRSHKTS